ncbi:MAG: hypothetical protein HONDAALG_04716 [Gammaproteobacteria bacterium]|jgi:saccharopine dehydrogenase-like NADP-dependent oxidoreductase|nr:hypothetical protein [Gammaproteobacteria bacterium]
MRILQIGAGGVGSSAALIAARRDFFEHYLIADYDGARATGLAARIGDERFAGIALDASSADAVAEACRAHGITHVLNVAGCGTGLFASCPATASVCFAPGSVTAPSTARPRR